MMMQRDFIGTIEAIYTVEGDVKVWLKNVLASMRPWFDVGAGIWACAWSINAAGAASFDEFVNVGGPAVSLIDLGEAMPAELRGACARLLRADFVLSNSSVEPRQVGEHFIAPLRPFGIVDIHLFGGRDVGEKGICIGRHLHRLHVPRRGEKQRLARLARHLVAGSRLNARLAGRPPSDAEAFAILTPRGRLEHTVASTELPDVRVALREAVLAMDRARGAQRRTDPDRAVGHWRVLADGRFSLIDRFESDGRRYVVACENEVAVDPVARLSPREGQVVALYRMGAPPKMIAYELGIADATVRVLLSRAARRIGLDRPRALRDRPRRA